MKLSEFKPAPPASGSGSDVPPTEPEAASPQAPQEEQYYTSVTPSGIEVAYSPAPRRHYKLWDQSLSDATDGLKAWREVPSVTSVLGVLDKSGPLIWWSQGIACDGIVELVHRGLLAIDTDGDPALYHTGGSAATKESLVDLLVEQKLSSNHQRDKAADRGVNVHGALENWVSEAILPDSNAWPENERGYVEGLYQFLSVISYAAAGEQTSELMVGSLEHSYAGRFDLVLTLSKPVEVVTRCYPKRASKVETIPAGRYLCDLKTTKKCYPTHHLQLQAYEAAAVECGYAPTDYQAVIRVSADGKYEFVRSEGWTIEDFLAVRKVYGVMNEREVVSILKDELDAREV